jgi:hypothetical protein
MSCMCTKCMMDGSHRNGKSLRTVHATKARMAAGAVTRIYDGALRPQCFGRRKWWSCRSLVAEAGMTPADLVRGTPAARVSNLSLPLGALG